MKRFLSDSGVTGIKPVESKLWLSGPAMHGEGQKWVDVPDSIFRVKPNLYKMRREAENE